MPLFVRALLQTVCPDCLFFFSLSFFFFWWGGLKGAGLKRVTCVNVLLSCFLSWQEEADGPVGVDQGRVQ